MFLRLRTTSRPGRSVRGSAYASGRAALHQLREDASANPSQNEIMSSVLLRQSRIRPARAALCPGLTPPDGSQVPNPQEPSRRARGHSERSLPGRLALLILRC